MKQSKITLNPRRIFIYKSLKGVAFLESPTTSDQSATVTTTAGTSGIVLKR